MSEPKKDEGGGIGKIVGIVILVIIVLYANVIGILADQFGYLMQVFAQNKATIFLLLVVFFLIKAAGSGKGGDKGDKH